MFIFPISQNTDWPVTKVLYSDFVPGPERLLYGHGFSYAKRLDASLVIDRENIEERVKRKEFDVIVLAGTGYHRYRPFSPAPHHLPFLDVVFAHYPRNKIIILDTADAHEIFCTHMEAYIDKGVYFRRELFDHCSQLPQDLVWHEDSAFRYGLRSIKMREEKSAATIGFSLLSPVDDTLTACTSTPYAPDGECEIHLKAQVDRRLLCRWVVSQAATAANSSASLDSCDSEENKDWMAHAKLDVLVSSPKSQPVLYDKPASIFDTKDGIAHFGCFAVKDATFTGLKLMMREVTSGSILELKQIYIPLQRT